MGFLKKRKNSGPIDLTESKDKQPPTPEEFAAAAVRNLAAASADDEMHEKAVSEDIADGTAEVQDDYTELTDTDHEEDDFIADPNAYKDAEPKDPDPLPELPIKRKKERRKIDLKKIAKRNKPVLKALGIAAGGIGIVCLGVYIYGCVTAPTDRMGRNLYIENVNVSNMTYDEALAAVSGEPLLSTQNITVTNSGQQYEINGVEIGLSPKLEDTVDKAMRYGKTTNPLINGLANTLQIFAKHTVVPSANVDEGVLREKLSDFGKQIYGELVEHQLEIGDSIIVCTPGHSGFDNNTDTAYEQVIQAINSNEKFRNIAVTLSQGKPKDLNGEDIDHFAYQEAADAYYAREGNNINVIPEVSGRIIDKAQADELAKQIKEGGEVINIPFTAIPAQVTAEQLSAKLFNATIGSYSTNYGTSNANRCANIANAAGRINGTVLMPGEVFSFNNTVGPRSVANGFHTAKEYVNGETVDGIGGGTCQVSSTLYNACIYADLSIISRTNHMFPVGYCPLGQDATVADTGVDYKFVNSMDYPIKISAVASGYTITVSIIGTQRDDPRTVKVVNSTSKIGDDTRVVTTRKVYNSAGELISTDQLPGSYYKPHD